MIIDSLDQHSVQLSNLSNYFSRFLLNGIEVLVSLDTAMQTAVQTQSDALGKQ